MERLGEYWLRKARRIIRGRYNEVRLNVVKVAMIYDEWYDVYMTCCSNIIYMDCLDKYEVIELVKALKNLCNVKRKSQFLDGFTIYYTNCVEGEDSDSEARAER